MPFDKGQAKSVLTIFEREYRPALIAFFLRRIGNRAEAEDLAQEVFLRNAKDIGQSIERADAYIFQVAANLLRDRARRQKVREAYAVDYRASWSEVDVLDPHRIAVAREALSADGHTRVRARPIG